MSSIVSTFRQDAANSVMFLQDKSLNSAIEDRSATLWSWERRRAFLTRS